MRLDLYARQLLGVPFRHQGRDPSIGIDCIGLIVLAGRAGGYAFVAHDWPRYDREPAHGLLEGYLQAALGSPIQGELQPGDIVTMDFRGATRHVGVLGEHKDGLSLIHTNGSEKRVTEALLNDKWRRRITGVYRPEHPA